MKLPFYTHLPLRLSWPLGMNSGHLPSFLTICVCYQALEDALGDNITDQSHQKVVHNFPPLISPKTASLWPSHHHGSWIGNPTNYLSFICVSGCRRKPWRACNGTDMPAFYRRRGSYLFKGCTLSVSFLAIDLINGPDHNLSPMAVTRRPGTVKPLLDMSKTSPHGLSKLLAQSQEPTSPSAHTGRPHGPATVQTRPNCPRLEHSLPDSLNHVLDHDTLVSRSCDLTGASPRTKGVVPGTGPVVLPSGDPGRLPAGTKRPVSCLGSEGIQYLSIFPQQCSFMQDLAIYDTFDAQVNLGSNAR
ncbi:hypothetical protein F2Q70_00030105 [Brassica cretica]|uniref:Uncharacterized protein n=1 Tax=Brassica cretica TaxID=69181 RepID=A0A8S9FK14_BRACR|nr:hypothetical protein F2Q70_00030105 [Brassica cretica]